MSGWVWLILGIMALIILYGFLIAPSIRRKQAVRQLACNQPYAHRGLHGGDVLENSLAAFRLAAQKGYGIELDVHLTQDDVLVVHHDDSLKRMCGAEKRISQSVLSEVQALRLGNTDQRVPTLQQTLDCLSTICPPLIVEMKSDPGKRQALPEKLLSMMEGYKGFWCVESFDPRMVRWFKKHAPQVIRGQLAFDPFKLGKEKHPFFFRLGAHLLMNFLSRPDFVAYGHSTDRNRSFRIMRRLFHPVLAAWTVQSKDDYERLRDQYDILIFEGFEP